MTIENEIIFKTYGITGYDVDAPGLCDDTTGASADDDPGSDGGQGLGCDSSGHSDPGSTS